MKKVTRCVTFYRCEVCGSDHKQRASAKKCESMPVEARIFKVGDSVRAVAPRICGRRWYACFGTIVAIGLPQAPDEDYEARWLGGRRERLGSHTILYCVEYTCPICRRVKEAKYYAPELMSAAKRSPRRKTQGLQSRQRVSQ
jgi:hypothetical protein